MVSNQLKQYQEWHSKPEVQYEIIKQLQNREFSMIAPSHLRNMQLQQKNFFRNLRCHNTQTLQLLTKKAFQIPLNLYKSLATYQNGVPYPMPYSKEEWNVKCHESTTSYDCLIDIDSPSHSKIKYAFKTAQKIKKFFDDKQIPYELNFTGMGFHIIIPYEYFMPLNMSFLPLADNNIYLLYLQICQYLAEKYSELIDTTISDSRRICKLPYTITFYPKGTFICHNFHTTQEFEGFELKNYCVENYKTKTAKRGISLFNYNSVLDSTNLTQMLAEMRVRLLQEKTT